MDLKSEPDDHRVSYRTRTSQYYARAIDCRCWGNIAYNTPLNFKTSACLVIDRSLSRSIIALRSVIEL